ncbi:hypothetical protein FAM23167_01822 [Lentilactobacillus parabuchneri]|nr:hypothetical protein FAM23167_01822 [Lentilactobacillus parabuchneri]
MPPNKGPSSAPETFPVTSVPNACPLRRFGTWVAIRALALLIYPEKTPCSKRSPMSCQTLVTSPIKMKTTAIPAEALTNMSFRPVRSANFPQRGEAMAVTK